MRWNGMNPPGRSDACSWHIVSLLDERSPAVSRLYQATLTENLIRPPDRQVSHAEMLSHRPLTKQT